MKLVIALLFTLTSAVLSDTASNTIVNSGVYKIQSDNDQNVLTASDNGMLTKKLGLIKSDVWSNTDEQKWTIRNSPLIQDKQLRSLTSRKNANNNVGFILKSAGTTATLRYWELVSLGSGKWQLKSYPDGNCLQSMGRTRAVEEKPCQNSNRSQRWVLLICNSLRCSERK